MTSPSTAVVIADIVASRRLADRAAAQRVLDDAIARVEADAPRALEPLRPTVGDELQAVYPDLTAALGGILLLRLRLPDDLDCRFGVGVGEVGAVASASGAVPEGPGWWAAREAIEAVHGMQQRAVPSARTRIVAAPGHNADMTVAVDLANAYALVRDEAVGAMSERTRRLTYGRCLGMSQRRLADDEGISQSAVSQALSAAGSAALVAGYRALAGAAA